MKRMAIAVLLLAGIGCANRPELRPAEGATVLTEEKDIAIAEVQNVRFEVDGGAWDGFPEELTEVVPVRVTVENRSNHPVRIKYEDVSLIGTRGSEFAALPPLQVSGVEEVEIGIGGSGPVPYHPRFFYDRFYIAGAYGPYYTGLSPWRGPFSYDPLYYNNYYLKWPVELPTVSMIQQSLPEGVISPGGQISGFIYFQDVPDDMDRVTFRAQVVNAETGERMGTIDIPFEAVDA